MNFREYMAAVDKKTGQMNEEQLRSWIHNYARQQPEGGRDSFLKSLELPPAREQDARDLEKLKKWLEEMRQEKYKLSYSEYEDYSTGCWDADWIQEYEDPDGIGEVIDWAYELAGKWVFEKKYKDAEFIYSRLNQMLVYARGGDGDVIELDVRDLEEEGIVSTNLEKVAVLTMYTLYQTHANMKERVEAISFCFHWEPARKIRIGDMLTAGPEELPDTEGFLEAWIPWLEKQNTPRDLELLEDAVLCRDGEKGLLTYARENVREHPSFIQKELQKLFDQADYPKVLKLGAEAVRKMHSDWEIRGRVAELAFRAARQAGNREAEREMLFCACCSRPTMMNELRWFAEDEKEKEKTQLLVDRVKRIKGWRKTPCSFRETDEKRRYYISGKEEMFEELFLGNYTKLLEWCRNPKDSQESSSLHHPAELGERLLLLGLYRGEEFGKALQALCGSLAGDAGLYDEESRAEFQDLIIKWKKKNPFPVAQQAACTAYLERTVDIRVCGIVSEQRRESYARAALLAASLGVVLKSLGDRRDIVQLYHRKFPNHRLFRSELRKYE